jgi:hypothetical protein
MVLNTEEQRLVVEFRKLGISARGDALSYITTLARHGVTDQNDGSATQCSIKPEASQPGKDTETIFTE